MIHVKPSGFADTSKPIECTIPRVSPHVKFGFELIIYECWLIHYNNSITLMQDVNNRERMYGEEGVL